MTDAIGRRNALAVLRDGGTFGGPIHPGEILREDFIEPLGVTPYAVAKAAGISQTRLGEILRGQRSVTADTAVRLAITLGTTAEFWLRLQADHDLRALLSERGSDLLTSATPLEPHAEAAPG